MNKWDLRFLRLANEIANWTKDLRHAVGCVIVDDDRTILSTGYNGFARNINDDGRLDDRDTKNLIIVHAEANAVAAAARKGNCLYGSTAYITHHPCAQCASLLIQSGVLMVVYTPKPHSEDWGISFKTGFDLMREAGLKILEINL